VPYRVDLRSGSDGTFDRLVELGAIDVELSDGGEVAALIPDSVTPERVAAALGADDVSVSPAVGRDAGSIWILTPELACVEAIGGERRTRTRRFQREMTLPTASTQANPGVDHGPVRVGRFLLVPSDAEAEPGALRLIDAAAFGTGVHPTTALCLEGLEEAVQIARPDPVLDVGTGSGVLALAALLIGVPRALGIDIDDEALHVAAENARINGLDARLQLTRGGPDTVAGTWPLILANVLAAPGRNGARARAARRASGSAGALGNSLLGRARR
jgi:hypothetical protein